MCEGGRFLSRIFLLLFILCILSQASRGQEDFHQQLDRVALLEQRGQYEPAIRSLRCLIDANAPSAIGEIGRAWTLLGIAYEDQGHYRKAQDAYEQALHFLAGDTQ